MTFNRRKITSGLLKKGFIQERKTKHIRYRFYFRNQRTGIHTKVSRGGKNAEISSKLISSMPKQCCISVENIRKLIECSLSERDYIELVGEYLPKHKEDLHKANVNRKPD